MPEVYWFQEGPGVRKWQFTSSGIKLLNVANIEKDGHLNLSKTDRHLNPEEVEQRYQHFLVDEGDLVIASSGISFDTDGLLRTRGAFVEKKHLPLCMNTSTIRFKAKGNSSDLKFLKYWLDSREFREQISRRVTGSAQQNFGPQQLRETIITLPPLPEQKRIAAILDKADRLRRLRRYALEISDTFLQSVFLQMFGDPVANPMGWPTVQLGSLLEFLTSGSRGWAKYYSEKGDLFLRIQNVGSNRLLLNDVAYVNPPDNAESRRTRVQPGDLLLSITADLGRTAVVPTKIPTAYINQHLALLRLSNINPLFVAAYINTPGGNFELTRLDREGVKSGLNFDDIRGFKVFQPPKNLQERFTILYSRYERTRGQLQEAIRQADHFFNTLLHRAFRSEL